MLRGQGGPIQVKNVIRHYNVLISEFWCLPTCHLDNLISPISVTFFLDIWTVESQRKSVQIKTLSSLVPGTPRWTGARVWLYIKSDFMQFRHKMYVVIHKPRSERIFGRIFASSRCAWRTRRNSLQNPVNVVCSTPRKEQFRHMSRPAENHHMPFLMCQNIASNLSLFTLN